MSNKIDISEAIREKLLNEISTGSLAINPTSVGDIRRRIINKQLTTEEEEDEVINPDDIRDNIARRIEFEKNNVQAYGIQLADGKVLRLYVTRDRESELTELVNTLFDTNPNISAKTIIKKVKDTIYAYDILTVEHAEIMNKNGTEVTSEPAEVEVK